MEKFIYKRRDEILGYKDLDTIPDRFCWFVILLLEHFKANQIRLSFESNFGRDQEIAIYDPQSDKGVSTILFSTIGGDIDKVAAVEFIRKGRIIIYGKD